MAWDYANKSYYAVDLNKETKNKLTLVGVVEDVVADAVEVREVAESALKIENISLLQIQ